jgi:hypothetical protein
MSSSIKDVTKKSSQIIEVAESIIKKLNSKQYNFPLTINQLKNSISSTNTWSLYLSSLAYLSENEIIKILDNGEIKLVNNKGRVNETKLDIILEDIKADFDYTLKKLAE